MKVLTISGSEFDALVEAGADLGAAFSTVDIPADIGEDIDDLLDFVDRSDVDAMTAEVSVHYGLGIALNEEKAFQIVAVPANRSATDGLERLLGALQELNRVFKNSRRSVVTINCTSMGAGAATTLSEPLFVEKVKIRTKAAHSHSYHGDGAVFRYGSLRKRRGGVTRRFTEKHGT